MIALATGLIKKRHEVIICVPYEQLAKENNCQFVTFGPEIKKQIRENHEKQKGGVAVKISPREGKKIILDQINLLSEKIKGVDIVLGAGRVMGVHTAADVLKKLYRTG